MNADLSETRLTVRQLAAICTLARKQAEPGDDGMQLVQDGIDARWPGLTVEKLNRAQASTIISLLQDLIRGHAETARVTQQRPVNPFGGRP